MFYNNTVTEGGEDTIGQTTDRRRKNSFDQLSDETTENEQQ